MSLDDACITPSKMVSSHCSLPTHKKVTYRHQTLFSTHDTKNKTVKGLVWQHQCCRENGQSFLLNGSNGCNRCQPSETLGHMRRVWNSKVASYCSNFIVLTLTMHGPHEACKDLLSSCCCCWCWCLDSLHHQLHLQSPWQKSHAPESGTEIGKYRIPFIRWVATCWPWAILAIRHLPKQDPELFVKWGAPAFCRK